LLNGWLLFKEKYLRRMFAGIKVSENWRKRYNERIMQLLGDLDILSFVRISQLNWIGHDNRIDSKKEEVSQVCSNNVQGCRLRGRPEKNTVQLCTDINPLNAELNPICYLLALLEAHHFLHVSRIRVNRGTIKTGKREQETELNGRSPLRRQRPALYCSFIEENQEEEEEVLC
jgi:hypothetical protein